MDINESALLDQAFQHHHSTAVMMLARSRINRRPQDPYYGYRDLAKYVHDGITDPMDQTDVYLRLLAVAKAERMALPSLSHMQALMSMVWDTSAIPPKLEPEFHQICHKVNEVLCFEIGQFATESMRSLAATLRVDLQVRMGYANEDVSEGTPNKEKEPTQHPASGNKPTLH